MRSGVCTLQQTLTAEAASVLKHSLGLARRRGHAQVTPLHVAATLLSLRGSSLRRACLKSSQASHHPLQCRALELCFNVALNRLPTTPSPLIHTQPSLSNALIAALKRAQAHQRRGCIEQQQQQPLLTIKVELEHLIISILDDPSVSRVMREAGFSSTAVKNHIEDSNSPQYSVFQCYNSSGGVFSSPCSPSASENNNHRETATNNNPTNFRHTTRHFLTSYASEFHPSLVFSPPKNAPVCSITGAASSSSKDDDVRLVLDILLRKKKKNTVIVGDSLSLTEGLVGEIMGRLERSEVPDELKSIHFIKFQISHVSLSCMKRDEVEMKLLELERKVNSIASGGGGGIFYIGDLKWTVEEASLSGKEEGSPNGEVSGYNPVDHLVSEIGKLFCDCGTSNNAKVWLMATASYQTYMRCQMRQPPLEKQWALQAVPVPSGGLGLSLHAPSVLDSKMTISHNQSQVLETKPFGNMEQEDKLNCCEECASNYEKEAQFIRPDQKKRLPFWLQSHITEDHKKDELVQLKRKWNRLCHCLHQSKQPQNQWSWNHNSYNSPSSISFASNATHGSTSKLVPRFRRQQSCIIEFNFGKKREATEPVLDSLESMEGKEVKTTLALGNGGSGESAVGDITDTTLQRAHICKLLQENVPWQSETFPSIAEALIDSKSAKESNNITWLLMQGNDTIGKRRLALAIAESVFGSTNLLLQFDMLKRETSIAPFSEMLEGALKTHHQLVMLIENVDFADAQFKKFLCDGFETGNFGNFTEENSSQVIFILTNGGSGSTNIEQQNEDSVMRLLWQVSETKPNLETPSVTTTIAEPCFGHKRRAELDMFSNTNSFQGSKKKEFSRQTSFNTLDLNMKADEGDKAGESSPISSDQTGETIADPLNQNGFLDSIVNRFEFNTNPVKDREMAELFLCKFKESFEEVYGKKCLENLSVDERVIEDVGVGCGYFTNSLFEKWLKDVFQSSLETVNFGGKEGILFRLSWGGKGDRKSDSGFMSSSLPKSIQVNYFIE
ncbi:Chaperone protein ClpB1 [Glycine soja]|nr:Chaperone protein ClpB1 [Glycine soja]